MKFEIGKQYIVDVTNNGIIPIKEFNSERFFDKDHDDLDFLTDEEKGIIIINTLGKMRNEIEGYKLSKDELAEMDEDSVKWGMAIVVGIIDKYIRVESGVSND